VATVSKKLPGSLNDNPDLDLWIGIEAAGTVTVRSGKVEIGQGLKTAAAQVAAEELDVSLARVRIKTADTAESADENVTSGSKSMEMSATALRFAAAECRAIMLDMAAERLNVDKDTLNVDDGTITSPATNQQLTYWELMGGQKFNRKATAAFPPKPPKAHRIVGTRVDRLDLPAKIFGQPAYVHDLDLPGMAHGRIIRPRHQGATLAAVDTSAVEALPGVIKVVRDGSFLAVIAETEAAAITARDALHAAAQWKGGDPLPNEDLIYDWLVSADTIENGCIDGNHTEEPPVEHEPPQDAALTIESIYARPFLLHGAMGPACTVAQMEGSKLTVYTHSQGVFPLRRALKNVLHMEEEDIRCIHMEGSGCYGHNSADDVALDAALLARALPGRPVRVQWTRDDEHCWEPFGTAMVIKVRASLDDAGKVADWCFDIWSNNHGNRPKPHPKESALLASRMIEGGLPAQSTGPAKGAEAGEHRNAWPGYDFGAINITKHFVKHHPFRTSSLRGLGAYANVFAIEQMMDELAHASDQDAVAFRLAHLSDPRARAVLEASAEAIGWGQQPAGEEGAKKGLGIAYARYKNNAAYCAVAVEVEVNEQSGVIRVTRAACAGDAGEAIAPDNIANQLEGGLIQSVSWTLKERVRFSPSEITSVDWGAYPILSFREAPEVEAIVLNRPGEKFLGLGEASQSPTAGAIANAVFNATGVRLRELPFTPDRVKAMIQEARRS
jgi:CO/xanthine dehydrogenase Mo-binding subunit